jgi:isopenicillin-N epimerase
MMLNRRSFLVTGALAASATAIKPIFAQQPVDEWAAIRREFDLDPRYTHLSLFFLASHPRPVREAIDLYRKRVDANPFDTVEHYMFGPPEQNQTLKVSNALASYIGGTADDIALTQNTTTGLSLIYHGLPLKAGDEILTTIHDHYSHHESIRLAAERSGATVRRIALFDKHADISADSIVDRIRAAIRPQTRVVGVTWVHSSSGLKLPIRRIADAIAEANRDRAPERRVLLVVDGVHGIGVEDPNIVAMGMDAFSAGTHKWIFGPRGTGFVWAKPEVWATMRPLIPTFSAEEPYAAWAEERAMKGPARGHWFSPGGFQAYEHFWALTAALDFHKKVGSKKITDRIHELNGQMKEGLAAMPHVTLYTPRSAALSGGIVCFDVKGMTPEQVVKRLYDEHRIIASTSPYARPYARVSFGIANTPAEVEKALGAIRGLA